MKNLIAKALTLSLATGTSACDMGPGLNDTASIEDCTPLVCTDTLRKKYGVTVCGVLDGTKFRELPFNLPNYAYQPDYLAVAGLQEEIGKIALLSIGDEQYKIPTEPEARAVVIDEKFVARGEILISKIDTVRYLNQGTSSISRESSAAGTSGVVKSDLCPAIPVKMTYFRESKDISALEKIKVCVSGKCF